MTIITTLCLTSVMNSTISYSYSLMLQCWDEQPEKRPDFSQLVSTLSTLLEAIAGYVIFSTSEKENLAAGTSLLYCNSTALDSDSKN